MGYIYLEWFAFCIATVTAFSLLIGVSLIDVRQCSMLHVRYDYFESFCRLGAFSAEQLQLEPRALLVCMTLEVRMRLRAFK